MLLCSPRFVGKRTKKSVPEVNPLIHMKNKSIRGGGRGALGKAWHYLDTDTDLTCGGDLPIFPAAVAVDSALRGLTNPQKPMENHERSRR